MKSCESLGSLNLKVLFAILIFNSFPENMSFIIWISDFFNIISDDLYDNTICSG